MSFLLKKILTSELMIYLYNQFLSLVFIILLFFSSKTDLLYIQILSVGLVISFLFNSFSIYKEYVNKNIREISKHSLFVSFFNFIFAGYSIYFMIGDETMDIMYGFSSIFMLFVSCLIISLDRWIQEPDSYGLLDLKLLIDKHTDKTEPSFSNIITSDTSWSFNEKRKQYIYYNGYIFKKYEGLFIDNLTISYVFIKEYLEVKDCSFSALTEDDIEVLKMYSI